MILRLIIENFLSFDQEVQFDMFPNPKRTNLASHIYTVHGEIPLLKQAAIYGPNGAGKSNLVKAMEFVKAFVVDKDFLNRIDLPNFRYLLKEGHQDSPIRIGIEIETSKRYFFYEIEIDARKVAKESLFEMFPVKGSSELVFERKGRDLKYAENVSVEEGVKNATLNMLAKNPKSSVLSLNREFPIILDDRCNLVYKWFKSKLDIIGVHSFLPTLIDILRKDKKMMEFARKLVARLEVGVNDFNMVESDFDQWAKKHIELANQIPGDLDQLKSLSLNANNAPILSINIENRIRKVYQLIFDNIGKNGFIGHLDSSLQSDGTLRVLTLLPALYFASQKEKTVVIDEINYCLSPTMVKGVVEYFAKTNDTNGQLIFTTHDTQLLEDKEDILRSDEIWFVDKHEGASVLYSHNDFKEHHTISAFRGYNEGRYGAIRFVNLLDDNGK